jgi:ATP-dependent Clp protease adaptor protein ClpS
MSEQDKVVPGKSTAPANPAQAGSKSGVPRVSASAPAKTKKKGKSSPKKSPPGTLPPWKVLLHNDDVNTIEDVVKTIVQLVHLSEQDAESRTNEAHRAGVALLTVTHKERAELFQEQFTSKSVTVSIEPA